MTDTNAAVTDELDRWADVYTLLAECFKQPSEAFVTQVTAGTLGDELSEHATALTLAGVETEPPDVENEMDLQTQYRDLFTAYRNQPIPLAESPYKSWYGNRDGGLMGGPSATEMERRYERLETSPPREYPADHLALLFEYAGLLGRAGADGQLDAFVRKHLDWIPALRERVLAASVDAPFYAWLITTTDTILEIYRRRRDLDDPTPASVDEMLERVRNVGDTDASKVI